MLNVKAKRNNGENVALLSEGTGTRSNPNNTLDLNSRLFQDELELLDTAELQTNAVLTPLSETVMFQ